MPIYELRTPGATKPRMIKGKDVSDVLTFAKVADIKAIGAERVVELQEAGIKLEKVPDATDPASYAPGGPLHGQTPPPGVKVTEAEGGGEKKEG